MANVSLQSIRAECFKLISDGEYMEAAQVIDLSSCDQGKFK